MCLKSPHMAYFLHFEQMLQYIKKKTKNKQTYKFHLYFQLFDTVLEFPNEFTLIVTTYNSFHTRVDSDMILKERATQGLSVSL